MVFNLNEQKVLSDPSGSSVFKGEKDFNDIVVNLPDNIDGHTATELKYVMHFVDSDGGYSTKILTVDSSGETLKATATVSTNITSKAQAFYAYVLMTDDEETVIGKTNGVIVMIHPVPDEENEIIPPADADKIIKGLEEIVQEATETIETATEAISSKQDKLTAGENITIDEDNVISAEGGGVTSYNNLTDKPSINNVTLSGNKTTQDLGLQSIIGNYFTVENNEYIGYNFNSIPLSSSNSVLYCVPFTRITNFPSSLSDKIHQSGKLYIFHYVHTVFGAKYLIRRIMGYSPSGNYAEFAQYCVVVDGSTFPTAQSDWVELTGGSQIVSGVVNANGTITFTDSGGNTFITSGSSVIGADGFSPVATVTQTASGATVSITDSTGTTTANISNGQDGNDYVLTAQDKSDIADIVLSELPTTQGVLYGNTSN